MNYYEGIQQELENGVILSNDSNPLFVWTTFTRGGVFQVHIYKESKLEIQNYKSFKTLAKRVGNLLNRGY